MALFWLLPAVLVFGALSQLVRAYFDHRRIRTEVENQGGKVVDIAWEPFHSSGFARNRGDVYRVTLEENDGAIRRLYCKTSLLEGVFFAEDRDEPMAMDLSAAGRAVAARRRARKHQSAANDEQSG
jgi:hypothetical protein